MERRGLRAFIAALRPRRRVRSARGGVLLLLSDLLDTPADERFDRITRIARALFKVPIALISLVDENRQWFKSRQGLTVCETSRDISFCGHAILENKVLWVEDARHDPRFHDNPLVTGQLGLRFYAGYPIRTTDGNCVGTLCIIDTSPRPFSAEHLSLLSDLGRLAARELESSPADAVRVELAAQQSVAPFLDRCESIGKRLRSLIRTLQDKQ